MCSGRVSKRARRLISCLRFSWVNESESERQLHYEAHVRGAGSFQEELIYSVYLISE